MHVLKKSKVYLLASKIVQPFAATGFFVHNNLFKTPRPRILVRNDQGQILLVRSWVKSSQWELPGGGIKKGEQPRTAACRELFEETGIEIAPDDLEYIGTLHGGYIAPVFMITLHDTESMELQFPLEIIDGHWYDVDALPRVSWCVSKTLEKLASKR